MTTPSIRLVVADDHAVVRAGLIALLEFEDDITVVGEAADVDETIRRTRTLKPDVLLLDITMPGGGGLRAVQPILNADSPPRIVVLSIHDDATHVRAALRLGVTGYVTKRSVDRATVRAVRAAAQGRLFIDPTLSEADQQATPSRNGKNGDRLYDLTPRMQEVLQLVAWGHTNEEVAGRLSITVKTVEAHRASIMRRLGLTNRADLVRYAFHAGLLQDPPSARHDA